MQQLGGVLAQGLAVLGIAPPFGAAALVIVVPSTIAVALMRF